MTKQFDMSVAFIVARQGDQARKKRYIVKIFIKVIEQVITECSKKQKDVIEIENNHYFS